MANQVVVAIQQGGFAVFGHDPIPGTSVRDGCPYADKKKGTPGGAFLVEVTMLQIARARVGHAVNLGSAKCTLCGAVRYFVMAQTHNLPPALWGRKKGT